MNKDTVVASVIGFGLGLVAAIALWIVPRLIPKTPITQKDNNQVLSETVQNSPSLQTFDVTSPKDGDISKSADLKISGKASPNTLIFVSSSENNQSTQTDDSGNFSLPLKIHEGSNEIAVLNVSNGKEETKRLSVYFVDEEL